MQVTDKQREVIEHLRAGMTSKEIARKVYISKSAVDNMIYDLFNKFGCENRTALINTAWERGIIQSKIREA